jgi:hypothetical protein
MRTTAWRNTDFDGGEKLTLLGAIKILLKKAQWVLLLLASATRFTPAHARLTVRKALAAVSLPNYSYVVK